MVKQMLSALLSGISLPPFFLWRIVLTPFLLLSQLKNTTQRTSMTI